MWEKFCEIVNSDIAPLEAVISLIEFVFVVAIFSKVTLGQKLREKAVLKKLSSGVGGNAAILIVDLNPRKDIKLEVEHFRQNSPELNKIPKKLVKTIARKKQITPEDIPDIVMDLRKATAEFSGQAVDLIHLFYAGPTTVPSVIGAELVNGCRVLLYQHAAGEGGYENWGPLRHAFIS